MRKFLLGALSAVALAPGVASAALVLNIESKTVDPASPGESFAVEGFFNELAPADAESINALQARVTIIGPGGALNPIRFTDDPNTPETDVFVDPSLDRQYFARLLGGSASRPGEAFPTGDSNANYSTVLVSILGRPGAGANPVDNDGAFRLPIIVPTNVTPGIYTLVLSDVSATDPSGLINIPIAGNGNLGTITVVPEPASLGLVALGGLFALRRRRTA